MNKVVLSLGFILFILLLFIGNHSYSQIVTKQLYLSDPAQALDQEDPVATADATTAQSSLLGPTTLSITNSFSGFAGVTSSSVFILPNVEVLSGTDRLMLVGVSDKDGKVTSVKYNNVSLNLVGYLDSTINSTQAPIQSGSNSAQVYIYSYLNPPVGTADIVVTTDSDIKKGIVVGVTNFSGVNQTNPFGAFASAVYSGSSSSPFDLTVPSSVGALIFDVSTVRNGVQTMASGQTSLYNIASGSETYGGSSTKLATTTSTLMSWSSAACQEVGRGGVSINPGLYSTATFTQSPALCNALTIKGGQTITVSNYLSLVSGTMPANPNITAELKYGGTNIITLSNPSYNSGTGLLTWTGVRSSDITIPAGQAVALKIITAEPSVSFKIDYDSQSKPSKIAFSMDSGVNIFAPTIPSIISGNISPSLGSSQNYSVVNVPGVTYNWVLPAGWTKTAGGNTNAITVTVGSLTGTISVTPNNGTCNGTARVLNLFTATKQLYLSDSNILDRIDPVATGDNTTASTPVLSSGSSVTVNLIAIKDTGIKLKNPTSNYGSCSSIEIDREATDLQRALFQFDLSSIPAGAVIESAELRLNCTTGKDMTVSVFKIGSTESWTEGTLCGATSSSNWNQRQSGTNWTTAGVVGGFSGGAPLATINVNSTGIQSWPITCLVTDWVTGATVNNGIMLGSQDGGGDRVAVYDSRETTTGVKPTLHIKYSLGAVAFTQSPQFCSPFTIKGGTPINITTYVSTVSGSMPSSPDITADLKTSCANTIITATNPSYDSTTGLLSWSGTLGADKTIAAGEAITLDVSSSQAGVSFKIDYDSQTKPSKIEFTTSTFIEMTSFKAYNAPYPGGSIITSAEAGSMVYLRTDVTDPFGAYDITNVSIDNQGTLVTPANVANTSCSKTFEYALFTPSTVGTYTYTATSKEGFENTVTDSESLNLTVTSGKIDFDGVDDHINFGNVHNLSSSFSLEAWVLQEVSTGTRTVISKTNVSSGNIRGYQLAIIGGIPNLKFFNSSGTTVLNISTTPNTLSINKWYHLAATFNGTTAKIFVDGIELASGNPSGAIAYGTESFLIGASYNSSTPNLPNNSFDGFIDEVRIWNVALTTQQIRDMMNQEIEQNGTFIKGKITSLNITGSLLWSNIKGYYPMDDNTADDKSGNNLYGSKKNITTLQAQTAPLPYTTKAIGSWTDTTATTPWTYGDTVWNIPNSLSIDGTTPINWNIVVTNHNIDINNNITVSGLIVGSNKIQVNGVTDIANGRGTGYGLYVTDYLKLNGKIDLEGDSQLIQGSGSYLDPASSGTLERDQQGTADKYTYNYWSSPVNSINNNSYKLPDVIKNIGFLTSGYDGTASPLRIADYWIWKFSNKTSGDYSQWQHVRSTGTMLVGEGFTMKGPGTGSIPALQNYIFEGKPNNGDINLTISAGNDYLVGNPYPSAIDANQFILDNGATIAGPGSTTGTLYFWQHWGGGSHILKEYQGGYATYTLADGIPAPFMGSPPAGFLDTPGRYIPVAQGFFVVAETSGTIKFNNGQRALQIEDGIQSAFIKSSNPKTAGKQVEDIRTKIRLGLYSVNQMHRELLVTVDSMTTPGYDWGYDAPNIDSQIDDMYWLIDADKYIIQATNQITNETILPIGIHVRNDGKNSISINKLENTPDNLMVFVHDKELNSYHNLKEGNYEVFLLAGDYLNRFEITFANSNALHINDVSNEAKIDVLFSNEKLSIIIQNPDSKEIRSVEMYNVLGQSIFKFDTNTSKSYLEYSASQIKTGAYILKIETEKGKLSKKVLVK